MRRIALLLIWFALLEGLWELLVGTAQATEVIAGLAAAAAATAFTEALRSRGLLRFAVELRSAATVTKLAWQLPVEFAVITWALVDAVSHRRRVRGRWVRVPYPTSRGDRGRWQRAFGIAVGTATPNAIVVDVSGGEAMLHSLRPELPGGKAVT